MAARRRAMQSGDVVGQRRRSAPEAKLQTTNLRDPQFDQERLARQTYLTVAEAMAYLGGFPSKHAFRVWATRRGIPKCRAAGLRFLRRDIDRAVQPSGERREERHAS